MTRRSRTVSVAGAVLLVIAVVASSHGRYDVAPPPVTAGPAEVVRAYVAAIDGRDRATARLLVTPERARLLDEWEDGWQNNNVSPRGLRIVDVIPESGEWSMAKGMDDVVFVRVSSKVRRHWWERAGRDGWGYLLGRDSPNERWLIVDEGPV